MEKSDKEAKLRSSRVPRLPGPKQVPLKDQLKQVWITLLSLSREKFFILFLFCLFLALVNAPSLFIPTHTYRIGETVSFEVKATRDMLVEDREGTEIRRQETAQGTLVLYDFDERAGEELQRRIRQGFQAWRAGLQKTPTGIANGERERRRELEKIWGIEISPEEFSALLRDRISETFEKNLIQLIQPILGVGVVNNKMLLMNEQGKGIIIRKLPSKQELQVKELERFPDLNEARDQIDKRSAYIFTGENRPMRKVAVGLAQKMIVPNLILNAVETQDRKGKAVQEVRPVLFQIKRGEVIVREGERINENQLAKIRMATRSQTGREALSTSIGLALLWGLFVFMVYHNVLRGGRILTDSLRDLIFLTSLLAASFLSIRTADFVSQILVGGLANFNPQNVLLAIPLAAAPMLVGLVLGPRPAILFALIQAFPVVLFLEGGPGLALYFTIGGLYASRCQNSCHNRWDLIHLGGAIGLINMASALARQIMNGRLLQFETPLNLLFALLGGIIAGIVVTGFSPLVEKIFGYTTDMTLLEKANMDQPLMRELMLKAPGTYHHSVIVGNMVEAAAEAIGAKSLLARVSAYYHDIGKIPKPLYFIENQLGAENKHEKLAPSMSSLILIGHVKDGLEMARQVKLETPIVDIINQHHGTSLISYFYQKAVELKGGDSNQVSMEDFRYPGPKPQTREAGLVMLADATEAASRTLVDPTPSRLQGLVQKIIQNAFLDGQLDECGLTLKDLNLIEVSFTKILNAIFHHRIEYPDQAAKIGNVKKKSNGDSDKQSSGIDRTGRDREGYPANSKSLGLS